MDAQTLERLARVAGFNENQAAFIVLHLAPKPHTHTADEIIIDPGDNETLAHMYAELVDTEVFEDGPVLHGDEDEDGEIIDVDEVET